MPQGPRSPDAVQSRRDGDAVSSTGSNPQPRSIPTDLAPPRISYTLLNTMDNVNADLCESELDAKWWRRLPAHPASVTMPPSKSRSPQSPRSETVYYGLRRAIIEQALMPGDKLTEDVIGDRFGVSRTIVRTALARLNAEGLVDMQPNKGATIAQPSLSEAQDVFETRMCLERQVLVRLAEKGNRSGHRALAEAHCAGDESQCSRWTRRNTSCGRVPYSAGGSRWQWRLVKICGRGGFTLLADPGALRPATFLGLLHERTPADHRRTSGRDSKAPSPAMDHHLKAVTDRALLSSTSEKHRDIRSILDRYAK